MVQGGKRSQGQAGDLVKIQADWTQWSSVKKII